MPRKIGNAKYCPKCQRVLPPAEFYKATRNFDKLTVYCKTCSLAFKAIWRHNNKEKILADDRYYRTFVPRGKYICYKKSSRRLGRIFTLTFEQFNTFWKAPCTYCGEPIKTIGLDRVDNTIGYTFDNVVSCCKMCNFMKRGYSAAAFTSQCLKITNRQRSKKQ
jgi:hypothetical protein